ncbi:MAG: GAF domain-containing protein [Anaerolineales bacterium]|nr:GAF domain-containing protein [Anaerolineales bacterium]
MLDRITRLFPPVSKNPDEARQENLFYLVVIGLALTGALFALMSAAIALLSGGPWVGVIAGLVVQPVYLAAIFLARRGQVRLATYFPVVSIFLVMMYASIALGLGHAIYVGYAMATLTAAILISTRSGILFAFLSMMAHLVIGLLQQSGTIAVPDGFAPLRTIWPDAVGLGLGLAVLISISAIYNREMRVSLQMEKQLAEALQNEHQELIRRIAENKKLLDQRIIQLRTLAETSMAAGAERKPLILLQSVMEVLQQRMNLSSAAIFLLEEPGPSLVLRAGSTPEAQRLIGRGYRHPEESTSLVRQAADGKRIFSEGDRPIEKDNPLSTGRSELVIPLLIGDRILGVLDVQSETVNAFDDSDILTLRGISQTLAHGLEMARLNAQSQLDREEVRALNRRYMSEAWKDVDQTSDLSLSVESSETNGEEIITPLGPSYETAAVPSSITRSADGSQITAPLILREQVIGALTLDTGEKEITQDDLTFIDAVTTQAALALENARLYSELTQRAAYLQTANEIARDASTTLDLDLLLRRVVELIRERFGFSHAAVYLMDEQDQAAAAYAASGQAGVDLVARRAFYTANSQSVVGHVLSTGVLFAVNNLKKDSNYQADPLLSESKSELGIPLIVAGRVIGVLDIHSAKINAFGADEIAILQTLSGQLAVAVQNARLFSQVSQRAERERKVVEITGRIRSSNDISSILQTAVSELRRALGISSGTVMVGPVRPAKIEEPKGPAGPSAS